MSVSHSDQTSRTRFEVKRDTVRGLRLPPTATYTLTIKPNGKEIWHPPVMGAKNMISPAEICMHLSDGPKNVHEHASLPPRFDFAAFFGKAVHRWQRHLVTLRIISYNGELLRCGILDSLDLLSQTSPRWRVILETDGCDLTSTPMIDQILRLGIDEVIFHPTDTETGSVNPRVLHAVKDLLDLRRGRGLDKPEVVCMMETENPELLQWNRQIGFDRLEMTGLGDGN